MTTDPNLLRINNSLSIPLAEIAFSAVRAGGPGGQHVNKVSTSVLLTFDLENSPSIPDEKKTLLKQKLANRLNKDGILRLVARESRSQAMNKQAALARFANLLRTALTERRPRKKTRIPTRIKEKRLQTKKIISQKKKQRSRVVTD